MTSNAERSTSSDVRGSPTSLQSECTDNHIAFRFHISCRRCKHFHKNKTWRVPKDTSRHVRFCCEKCQSPLAGINHASTQVTLASEESFLLFPDGVPRRNAMRNCRPHFLNISALLLRQQPSTPPSPDSPASSASGLACTQPDPRLTPIAPVDSDPTKFSNRIKVALLDTEEAGNRSQGIGVSKLRYFIQQWSQKIFRGSKLIHIRKFKGRFRHKPVQALNGECQSRRDEIGAVDHGHSSLQSASRRLGRMVRPVTDAADPPLPSVDRPPQDALGPTAGDTPRHERENLSRLAVARKERTAQRALLEQRCQCGPPCCGATRASTMCTGPDTSLAISSGQVPEHDLYEHVAVVDGEGNPDVRRRGRSVLLSYIGHHLRDDSRSVQRRQSTGSPPSSARCSCSSCTSNENMDELSRRSSSSPVRRALNSTNQMARPALGSRNSYNVVNLTTYQEQASQGPHSHGLIRRSVSSQNDRRHQAASDPVVELNQGGSEGNLRQTFTCTEENP